MIGNKARFSTLLRQCVLNNGCTLSIKHGDITKEKVDVIVNNANGFLIHEDGLALNLLRAGGTIIQDESNEIIK